MFSGKGKPVLDLWVQLGIEVEMSVYKGTCHSEGASVTSAETVTLANGELPHFQGCKQFLHDYAFGLKSWLRTGGH